MVKVTRSKNSSKSKSKKVQESCSDESSGEEATLNQHGESQFLSQCKEVFGTSDLYEILDLHRGKALQSDIKKAYYKFSLKYHPDKVIDESKKEESTTKFQLLGKVFTILNDEEKRKLYDEQGIIDNENNMFSFSNGQEMEQYWRTLFKKVTKEDMDKFFSEYKDSEEEKEDLIKYYEKFKGDFSLILENIYSEDVLSDEERFRSILNSLIDEGKLKKYDLFVKESQKKANKRKMAYQKEAKEAEKVIKEMNLEKGEDGLKNAILARRQAANDNFLDNLAKKYGALEKKGGKSNGKNVKSAAIESDQSDEVEDDNDDDSEEEENNRKSKKKANPIKKSAAYGNGKKTKSGKVKRL